MIISIDSGKAFDKIQHPFIIKVLKTLGIERTYLNIIKAIHDQLITIIILNDRWKKYSGLKSGRRKSNYTY
jgi:hypothetical protein